MKTRKIRKPLALLLALCLLAGCLPLAASAEGATIPNAEATNISGTYAGGTLPTGTYTYTLTGNVTLEGAWEVPSDANVTIDLGSYTLTGPTDSSVVKVQSGGKLTVTGTTGSISVIGNTKNVYAVNNIGGTFEFKGGILTGTGTGSYPRGVQNLGTFTMTGGKITAPGKSIMNNGTTAVANISSGEISGVTSGSAAIQNQMCGTLIISDDPVIRSDGCRLVYSVGNSGTSKGGVLDISGGTFSGNGNPLIYTLSETTITGGTFTSNNDTDASYVIGASNTLTIGGTASVVADGTKGSCDGVTAFAGSTVTVKDTASITTSGGAAISIGAASGEAANIIVESGTLTGKLDGIRVSCDANVTVKDGTITGDNNGIYATVGNISVTGGTITGGESGIRLRAEQATAENCTTTESTFAVSVTGGTITGSSGPALYLSKELTEWQNADSHVPVPTVTIADGTTTSPTLTGGTSAIDAKNDNSGEWGDSGYDYTSKVTVTGGTFSSDITNAVTIPSTHEVKEVTAGTTYKVTEKTATPTTPSDTDTPSDEPVVETVTSSDGTVTTTTTWSDGKQAVAVTTPAGDATVTVTSGGGETIADVSIPSEPGEAKEFVDVNEGDWFKDAVDEATGYGLFSGTSATTFEPQTPMTRGMLAKVLHNMSGNPGYGVGDGVFEDVHDTAWYADAVDWAAKTGVVKGVSDAAYAPNQEITREQMVAMLYRYAQAIGAGSANRDTLTNFPDGDTVSNYAKDAMQWAVAEGLILGRGNAIAPQGTATRAEVAAVLTRFTAYLTK